MAIEIPDEHGLSSDSLRGSHYFVRPDLVGAEDTRDPLTNRPNGRAPLSANEILTLENVGILVDENGYEREPEPVEAVAPVPVISPRVRNRDNAPARTTEPSPPVQIPVDHSVVPIEEDPTPRTTPPSEPIPPFGGTPPVNQTKPVLSERSEPNGESD